MTKLSELSHVSLPTLYKWKKEEHWEEETLKYQQEVKKRILDKIKTPDTKDQKLIVQDVDDAALLEVVRQLVGGSVTTVVSDYLSRVHAEDLKDLAQLNKAIRRKLDKDEEVHELYKNDDRELKLQSLGVKQIAELVTAKINLIKGVRLILGQTTENTGKDEDEIKSLTMIVTPEMARSLNLLENLGVVDTTCTVVNEEKEN